MKKKKQKKLKFILILSLIVIIVFVATMYYIVSRSNSYSFNERKWINEQSNTKLDVSVQADLPVFSLNGEGVYYDYIKKLENDTSLSFNITHGIGDKIAFKVKTTLEDTDLVFFKDHYAVISKKDNNYSDLDDLFNKKVGVIATDLVSISYYLTEYPNIEYKTYQTQADLAMGLNSNDIDYAIVPLYQSLNTILNNNFFINYNLDGLHSYFTLSLTDENKELNSIMTKFLKRWSIELDKKIGEYFLKLYYNANNFSEIDKESVVNDDYIVGYVQSLPHEGKVNRIFSGINSAYLSSFGELTGATYKYVEYSSLNKLVDAIKTKKVDIIYNSYSLSNENYTSSLTLGDTEYVVLANQDSTIVIDSLYNLGGKTVLMLADTNLTKSLGDKKLFTIKTYKDAKTLFKNMDEESIIITEKYFYDYYKDSKLKNYSIRLFDDGFLNTSYLLKSDNKPFNELFNFYLSTLSHKEYQLLGVKNILVAKNTNIISNFLINNVVYVIIVGSIIGIIIYRFTNKLYISKRIKKEDRMLYLDVMTNLKNRNYLNDNIDYWEKNKVFPQTIIMLDLNRIKELNDKKGHEEGDKQIRAAANVLIRTQRENSEIMRTDGNEFMIYLVGYEEKTISSYIHKLNKEFKNSLPYENYGVAIGFSMINDEIKTIDDAINEAAIIMRSTKGGSSEK